MCASVKLARLVGPLALAHSSSARTSHLGTAQAERGRVCLFSWIQRSETLRFLAVYFLLLLLLFLALAGWLAGVSIRF